MKKELLTLFALVSMVAGAQTESDKVSADAPPRTLITKSQQTKAPIATNKNSANKYMMNAGANENAILYNFNDGTLQGWTNLLVNDEGGQWVTSTNNPGGYNYDESTNFPHDGIFVMSYSYIDYDGSYDTDNYFVSPQAFQIPENGALNFDYGYANYSYMDYFEVCVATTSNTYPEATDFVKIWDMTQITSHPDDYGVNMQLTIDLNDYAGQEIWIGFHHKDYDMYELWLDNISITTTLPEGIAIDEEHFPDAGFRAYLTQDGNTIDANHNGFLSDDEIAAVKRIDLNGTSISTPISDLTGIEIFTELDTLDLYKLDLTTLDLSENTKLRFLSVTGKEGEGMTSLDVTGCTELEILMCEVNKLATLDISNNTKLKWLICSINQLTTLDVSHCTQIQFIDCHTNLILDDGMDAFVESLPVTENGILFAFYSWIYPEEDMHQQEGNVMTKKQVEAAKTKGWTVYDSYNDKPYEGIEPEDGVKNIVADGTKGKVVKFIGNGHIIIANDNGEYTATGTKIK